MTDTRIINLADQFRLPHGTTDWAARIVAAYPHGVADVDWETPSISDHWDPVQVDEEATVDLLIQAAVADGIIACPDGMDINFVCDGDSYWFAVDIGYSFADQVSIATWGYEMRKLVGSDVRGAEAAESILVEAVSAANDTLHRLRGLFASCSS